MQAASYIIMLDAISKENFFFDAAQLFISCTPIFIDSSWLEKQIFLKVLFGVFYIFQSVKTRLMFALVCLVKRFRYDFKLN